MEIDLETLSQPLRLEPADRLVGERALRDALFPKRPDSDADSNDMGDTRDADNRPGQSASPLQSGTLAQPQTQTVTTPWVRIELGLRTLGADRGYAFSAVLVNAHTLFVTCQDLAKYPFKPQATILQGELRLTPPQGFKASPVSFLGKIDAVHAPDAQGAASPAGFIVKIIQIGFEDKTMLESIFLSSLQIA